MEEMKSERRPITTLMNGMPLDANNNEGRKLSFFNFFGDIQLKQAQSDSINTLMNRIMMIPVMIIYNIIDNVKNSIGRLVAIPMRIGSNISLIVNSFNGTFATIKSIFRRLKNLGFGMKKVKAMTVDIFATILSNLINAKMAAFDAYIAKLSNKALSLSLDGVKAVPFAGTVVAVGTAVNTTGTAIDESLDNIASNMQSVATSLDNESNNLEDKGKKDSDKAVISEEINKKLEDDDLKKGGKIKKGGKTKKRIKRRMNKFKKLKSKKQLRRKRRF